MKQYLDVLKDIMENGVDRDDRTETGTRSVFSKQLRFNLQEGFPAVTTKRLAWKAMKSELLWFLEGSSDERRLAEILYGKDRSELTDKTTIWTANANADYWKDKAEFDGDLGRVYGKQFVDWRKTTNRSKNFDTNEKTKTHLGNEFSFETPSSNSINQIEQVIDSIKNDPYSRRHLVIAYNPGEIDDMALPPCHTMFQFYVSNNKLSCHMYQRSADIFLGSPFNIASYALLTHMVAQVCDLDVGELVITNGDTHIYHNHFDQVREQITREPYPLPTLRLNPSIKNINDFTMDDIHLDNYQYHETISAPMAV